MIDQMARDSGSRAKRTQAARDCARVLCEGLGLRHQAGMQHTST